MRRFLTALLLCLLHVLPASAQDVAATPPPEAITQTLRAGGPLDLVRSWPLDANNNGVTDFLVQAARPIGGGNAVVLEVTLFLGAATGGYVGQPLQGLDGGIKRVALTPGGLDVTLFVLREGDARCCPKGERQVFLDLRQLR